MNMFLPLKVTTDYTMLESMITIPKLALFLEKYHIPICGICDKNLYGVMEFYDTMMAHSIKPLIGLEVSIDSIPLYLYARNYLGYQALLKIGTILETRALSYLDLETYQTHLNIILPFLYMEEYKNLKEKVSHLYVGYSSMYEQNQIQIITENTVFCPDLKAFMRKEKNSLNLLQAIAQNSSLKLIELKDYEKNTMEYYFKEDLVDESTKAFCDSCQVVIPKDASYIPKFDKNIDSNTYLENLSRKGLVKRLQGNVSKEYETRFLYELSVIQKMGFADYFLIVYDYVLFAKKHGILVGAGRGSAVGSLISYSLGITDVDPLEYHLLFERFLNPERVTMPDIDIDFEEERRDEVVNYVKQRYGESCVANIMTFGTLKCKLVLRSVGKCMDLEPTMLETFVNFMDAKLTLKENLANETIKYYINQNEQIKKLVEESLKIEGLKKHISTHAAGVVISSVPLDTVIPIHYNGNDLLTGVTMNYLEELGLLKMDFLALRNLTIMKNVLHLIEDNTHQKLDLKRIQLNDPKVLKLFTDGNTIGIFQFESEGMKTFLKKLKPTKFLDLVSALALYRPGPMENIDTYIKRKEKQEKVTYLHEDLKPILEETYGIIVYQEQIMQILVKIGGFSFAEADTIRRAMSKKKRNIIEASKESFLKGACQKGYDKKLVEEIFELILKFANYGFNKSHSVSYAYIGYQMAYLKSYFPVYFIVNLLNMSVSLLEKTKEYLTLAKQMGVTILKPRINESTLTYQILGKDILLPFTVIKNIGDEAAKTIVMKREEGVYVDFFDFVARTYGKSITRKTIETLISAGAFDEFCTNHNTLRKNISNALNYAELSSDLEDDFVLKPTLEETEEETEEEKRIEEMNSFGFYISNHPASKYMDSTIVKIENIEKYYDKHINCVVLLERIKKITTKTKEKMAFLSASDETGSASFVVFKSMMNMLENVSLGDLVLIRGRVARRFSDYQINVNKIEKISKE